MPSGRQACSARVAVLRVMQGLIIGLISGLMHMHSPRSPTALTVYDLVISTVRHFISFLFIQGVMTHHVDRSQGYLLTAMEFQMAR